MSNKKILYQLKNIRFRYNDRFELNIPELDIPEGSSVGFIGPNGGGKSTLLKIFAFIEQPQDGEIIFSGNRLRYDDQETARSVTILLQEPYLLKRSVFENVAFGLKVRGKRQGLAAGVHEALEMVGLDPVGFAARSWYELSGGEAQRVALAMRLIIKPRVLILDEPTISVDEASSELIKEAVLACREKYGTTLLIASHDQVWLNSITNDIRKVSRGRITGSAAGNLIAGPWQRGEDGLYLSHLPDGQAIFSTVPPHADAQGFLDPSDIILSMMPPEKVSAQNIINAVIVHMRVEEDSSIMSVGLRAGGMHLVSRITLHAAKTLNLFPGEQVWAVFKASSIKWG
jgi:tungstate transport system ATP-binding protein